LYSLWRFVLRRDAHTLSLRPQDSRIPAPLLRAWICSHHADRRSDGSLDGRQHMSRLLSNKPPSIVELYIGLLLVIARTN